MTSEPKPSTSPKVLIAASRDDERRVSLYLHPDDYKALGAQKLEDGADVNTRLRALIAVYRSDDRVKKKVDKLAAGVPRGPRRGRPDE